MNRLHIYILLSVCFALLSCAGADVDSEGRYTYPVRLMTEQGDAHTRIGHDDISVYWEDHDILGLTAVDPEGRSAISDLTLFSIDKEDSGKASFSGFVTMPAGAPEYCYFTYPTGSAMEVNPSTGQIKVIYTSQDGSHKPYMYARTAYSESGMSARLLHLGAVLEITLEDGFKEDVAQISFVGNSLECLSPLTVDPATDECTFSSEIIRQITVNVQKEGKTYISVPPVKLDKGFTLVCSNADGTKNMFRSFSTDGSSDGGYDFSIRRGTLIPVVLDGSFETFDVSCTAPQVTHMTKDGLLYSTSVSFQMSKQGVANKLIEEWGAHLMDSEGNIVRSAVFAGSQPISSQIVTMDVPADWKLLPGGTYSLAPYYKLYGQKKSLPTQTIVINDPGIALNINGTTSYDKYIAGNTSGANSHTNTLIEGVSVSFNVHPDLIEEQSVIFDGTSVSPSSVSGQVYSFGNFNKNEFRNYRMEASFRVGKKTYKATKDFVITGLPMTADFTLSNPTGWTPAWSLISAKYDNSRIVYNKTSGIRSPKFYTPSPGIKVKTSCDCGHNVTSNSNTVKMTIAACTTSATSFSSGATLSFNKTYYTAGWASGFKSVGYLTCSTVFTLTENTPSLIYGVSLGTSFLGSNTFVSFRHKIEYSDIN